MRSLRSRPADHRTAALARARVAQLAGARLAGDAYGADGAGPGGSLGGQPRHAAAPDRRRAGRPPSGPDGRSVPAPWDAPDPAGAPVDGGLVGAPAGEPGGDGEARSPEWLDALQDRLPLAARPRLGLERVHLAVIVLVVLVGVIGAVVLFLLARPEVVPIEPEVLATGTPAATGTGSPPGTDSPSAEAPPPDQPAAIVVHVAGLVARPGIVELPAGSRVVDAIDAAGGATPEADLTPINLARVLADGEQVLVTADPPPPQVVPPAAPPAGGSGASTPAGPVDLNTATAAELETLPGIGPALAGRILEWRAQNGRFTTIDELREVSGIGEQRFAQLEPLVTV